jgi:hypothetical protein
VVGRPSSCRYSACYIADPSGYLCRNPNDTTTATMSDAQRVALGYPPRPKGPRKVLGRYVRRTTLERKLTVATRTAPPIAVAAPVERPRERRATTRRTTRAGPDDEPSPRPRLTPAERAFLKQEVDRRRRIQVAHLHKADRALFDGDAGRVAP